MIIITLYFRYIESADDKQSNHKRQWQENRILQTILGNRIPIENEQMMHFLNDHEKQEMSSKQSLVSLRNELENEYFKSSASSTST